MKMLQKLLLGKNTVMLLFHTGSINEGPPQVYIREVKQAVKPRNRFLSMDKIIFYLNRF